MRWTNDVYYCPNADCGYTGKSVNKPMRCPECNVEMKKIGAWAWGSLYALKKKRIGIKDKLKGGSTEMLITNEMSDDEITKRIQEDMVNLAMHEAGTGWMRLGTLLSVNTTEMMLGAGFKALIDQNKIIIRQNELLLRALKMPARMP